MKIKKIECEQFAGIRGKKIEFDDSINLIYGKNESGKSTMLELLHALLFQDVLLDKRRDKEFISKNFPHNANGKDLDVINGSIILENEGEQYILTKEWEEKSGSEKLIDSNGNITKKSEDIKEVLKKVLMFEQGVYDEIIFSSQKIPQHTLESIFGECSKKDYDVKNELHSILMKSVAEIGGADIDTLENTLKEKMNELASHFDVDSKLPEGGANAKRRVKEVGKILKAYNKLNEDVKVNNEVFDIEKSIENISNDKDELKKDKEKLKSQLENIGKYEKVKIQKDSIKGQINYQSELINDGCSIISNWEKFEKEKNELDAKKVIEVSREDVIDLREKLNEIKNIETTFRALNLEAKIDNKSGKDLLVTNVENGKQVNGQDGKYEINGCTSIELPGIININLAPKGIDLDELKNKQIGLQDSINEILSKYNVENLEELESLKEKYDEYQNKKNKINGIYDSSIKGYEEKYKTVSNLKKLIDDAKNSIDRLNNDLSKLGEIPKEYDRISNFEEYKKEKEESIKRKDMQIENLTNELIEEQQKLAGRDSESLKEEIEKDEKEFNDSITEYKHYENIYDKFCELKKVIKDNPMTGIEDSFNKYLKQISNNDIKMSDGKNLGDISIESKNNRLTFETLSEGTKATIGIAFKLSVLEHLFPNGQAVAIFDDPFTDMDVDRVKESCDLIKKFSEKNQVIFVTCDEKYNTIFSGANVINM